MHQMIVTPNQVLAVWLLIASILHTSSAAYNVTAYCSLVKSGIKLPSTEACPNYYVCQNQGYTENACDSGYSFDKDLQSCQSAANVNCFYGLKNPCLNKNVSFVPQVNTCRGWIHCSNDAEAGRGECPVGTVFKSGGCVYGECTNGTDQPDTTNICDVMPINTFFGNSVDCSQYQICNQKKAVPDIGSCPNGLMYDTQMGLCNYGSNTDCSRVTNPGATTPLDNEPCTEAGASKPSNVKCSEYYSCINGKWNIQSCNGMYWDTKTNKCAGRQEATPDKNCDRCEGTSKQFVNAVDPNCTTYSVCANGKAVNEGNCDDGYFDEAAQACILTNDDQAYVNSNGACAPLNDNCECGEPDNETGKCASTVDCECGLSATNKAECVVCSSTADPNTGICLDDKCECEQRQAKECANASDGCACALDENDETKCVECTDGKIEEGVCEITQTTTAEKFY